MAEICGDVQYAGGNEIVCVAEKGHDQPPWDTPHNYWPFELVNLQSTTVTLGERNGGKDV